MAVFGLLNVLPVAEAASAHGQAAVDNGNALSVEIKAVDDDDVYFSKPLSAIQAFNRGLSYAKQAYRYDQRADEYERLADRYEDEGDFLKSLNAERLALQSDSLALYYYNLAYGSFSGADAYFKKGDLKKKLKVVIKNTDKARSGK